MYTVLYIQLSPQAKELQHTLYSVDSPPQCWRLQRNRVQNNVVGSLSLTWTVWTLLDIFWPLFTVGAASNHFPKRATPDIVANLSAWNLRWPNISSLSASHPAAASSGPRRQSTLGYFENLNEHDTHRCFFQPSGWNGAKFHSASLLSFVRKCLSKR